MPRQWCSHYRRRDQWRLRRLRRLLRTSGGLETWRPPFRLEARLLLLMLVSVAPDRIRPPSGAIFFLPAGSDQGGRAVQCEICRAVDDEQFRKQLACARNPALYRTDRYLADRRRFVIGEARRGDQKQRPALNVKEPNHRL